MSRRRSTTLERPAKAPAEVVIADPVSDRPPIEQRAVELLSTVPPDLVSDALRQEAVRVAQVRKYCREVSEAANSARAALQQSLDERDVEAAITAGIRLASVERLEQSLPSITIGEAIYLASLQDASNMLRPAVATLPPPPVVSFAAEMAAWRSLGPIVTQQTNPPVLLPGESEAQADVEQLADERKRLANAADTWHQDATSGVNLIDLLSSVGGQVDRCHGYVEQWNRISEQVLRLNAKRSKGGSTWHPPSGISTPELELLMQHRTTQPLKGN